MKEKTEIVNEEDNCPVCLTVLLDPISLRKCKHLFCERCIEDSYELTGVKKCPLCRVEFKENDMVKMIKLQASLQTKYSKELAEKRKTIPDKRVVKLIIGNTTKKIQSND